VLCINRVGKQITLSAKIIRYGKEHRDEFVKRFHFQRSGSITSEQYGTSFIILTGQYRHLNNSITTYAGLP
jgi:hypothetical protein